MLRMRSVCAKMSRMRTFNVSDESIDGVSIEEEEGFNEGLGGSNMLRIRLLMAVTGVIVWKLEDNPSTRVI